ncbi:MAG: hypothetical protein ACR2MX_14655, partial [Cyclobacteriaceae bacterium]
MRTLTNTKSLKLLLSTIALMSLSHYGQAQDAGGDAITIKEWFGILELPFLLVCLFFAFRTAQALKGGVFGEGMSLL